MTDFHEFLNQIEGFYAEFGVVHLGCGKEADGTWGLDFSVVIPCEVENCKAEKLVYPTHKLKAVLTELGLTVERDAYWLCSKVDSMTPELLRGIGQAVEGDQSGFWKPDAKTNASITKCRRPIAFEKTASINTDTAILGEE